MVCLRWKRSKSEPSTWLILFLPFMNACQVSTACRKTVWIKLLLRCFKSNRIKAPGGNLAGVSLWCKCFQHVYFKAGKLPHSSLTCFLIVLLIWNKSRHDRKFSFRLQGSYLPTQQHTFALMLRDKHYGSVFKPHNSVLHLKWHVDCFADTVSAFRPLGSLQMQMLYQPSAVKANESNGV